MKYIKRQDFTFPLSKSVNIPTATKRFLVNVIVETTTLDDYLRCEL